MFRWSTVRVLLTNFVLMHLLQYCFSFEHLSNRGKLVNGVAVSLLDQVEILLINYEIDAYVMIANNRLESRGSLYNVVSGQPFEVAILCACVINGMSQVVA